jgi:hypothetical protein
MTVTAAPTDRSQALSLADAESILKRMDAQWASSVARAQPPDRREPGDGKKKPFRHIVRIVVVRPLPESNGVQSGTSLFDVLKPTDIVVVGREPASVRTVDSEGNPKERALDAHNHHHKDTVLPVWTESDTIEYQCDRRFEIVKVEKEGWKIYNAPDNPFGSGKVDYKAQERQLGRGKKQYFWTSSVLPATANNQQYKMTFKIFDENGKNGKLVDPDIVCGNPPPTP